MKEPVILCVDDEEIILKSLKRELNDSLGEDYIIETAGDGEDALEVFTELLEDEYEIPLVISDHIMPDMKGDELLKRIHVISPKTLKIMLTGQADLKAVTNAVNYAGLYQYIAKPWEKAGLELTVKEALRSYFQERKIEEQHEHLQKAYHELEQLNVSYERFVPREFLSFLNRKSIVDVQLGDQIQKEITILFSDIRSFTALSEQMTPQENFDFLNTYLRRMGPIIRKHQGLIDKYIGDGVMAIFPRRAEDAINASIDMLKKLSEYNADRIQKGRDVITVGIGIHIGYVMLGTVGEEERMQSTVISNTVNLASRLEGLTKRYGASIIVSEHTLARLENPERYHTRFLGEAQVKGKKEAVAVFEIYDGDPDHVKMLKANTKADFEQGLHFYFAKEFDNAATFFQKILEANPHDTSAALFLERSVRLMDQCVSDDWQGVETIEDE